MLVIARVISNIAHLFLAYANLRNVNGRITLLGDGGYTRLLGCGYTGFTTVVLSAELNGAGIIGIFCVGFTEVILA
jgi:hypothetical protein